MSRMSTEEINAKLAEDVERLCRALIPGGRRQGNEWYASGSQSPTGYAVAVVLSGAKRGRVLITGGTGVASAKGGCSLVGLIHEVMRHGDWPDTYAWALDFLGIEKSEKQETPEERRAREEEAERRRAEREEQERLEREDSIRGAVAVWEASRPGKGSLAQVYFETRGLDPALIDWDHLRYHPSLKHATGDRWPAVVARVIDHEGRHVAVWRIFISQDGKGKAPVENAKLGLGPAAGACVPIGGDGEEVGLCEGLETGLAVRELGGCRIPVWPCLSTSGLSGIVLPWFVKKVRIFPDGDKPRTFKGGEANRQPLPPGQVVAPPGRAAALKAAAQLREKGITVVVEAEPKVSRDYLDILNTTKGRAA